MTAATLLVSTRPLAEAYDVALLDLDGVCYRGSEPVMHAGGAVAHARAAGMRMAFVTNNAAREPRTVADHLASLEIPATEEEVVTSAQAAAALLAEELPAGAPVLAVGGPGLRSALLEAGLSVVTSADDAPVAVAHGFARDVGWAQLTEAVYAIRAGARYVATNVDATLPTERGMAVGNGSLVAAVSHASGVRPTSAGKPQPGIFRHACARAGAERPLVIGDRLDTDLAGGRAAGIPGLHVLTGVSDARDVLLAPPDQRPSYLSPDLRGLLTPHSAPEPRDEGWWACGDAAVRIVTTESGRRLEVDDGTAGTVLDPGRDRQLSADAWRAAAAASWAAADADRGLRRDECPLIDVEAPR